ncbi:MAG: M15 family metallopeptidase [Ruminococcus sp.]|nr:M15 family metallopeptidase [Ruminococcus sp.]
MEKNKQTAASAKQQKNKSGSTAASHKSRRPVSQKKQQKHTFRRALDIISAVVLLGGFSVAVGYPLIAGMTAIDSMTGKEALANVKGTDDEGNIILEPPTEPPTEGIFENVALEQDAVYEGSLLLVNSDYPFRSAASANISTLYDRKTESYSVSGMDISMQDEAIQPLNDMLDGFCTETGHYDILVIDGYRTLEQQQALYDADLAATGLDTSTLVAKPGHSEHETGYALDFSLFFWDGTSGDYDGTGDYDWIDQHCADYGYILRYPADKTEITNIQYESWHYRYVGKPHAYYIMQSGICLEEYIDELKDYSAEAPLEIVDSDGAAYAVYYVPADLENAVTYAPILPDHPYTVSGNNIDGFIITVDLEETRELVSYTKPVEEVTGVTTDINGNVVVSGDADIAASTTATTVEAVG